MCYRFTGREVTILRQGDPACLIDCNKMAATKGSFHECWSYDTNQTLGFFEVILYVLDEWLAREHQRCWNTSENIISVMWWIELSCGSKIKLSVMGVGMGEPGRLFIYPRAACYLGWCTCHGGDEAWLGPFYMWWTLVALFPNVTWGKFDPRLTW